MGLTMGHDGPGGPVEGYETVPLLIAGAVGSANRRGVAVLRRRTPRPSKRAVVYVHCLDDSFVPADLARWYTDRGFDFYAADLRAVGGGGPGTADASRTAGELNRYFASLDAAITHLRAADAIETVVVSAHSAGALFAALWCHARRGSRPVDALILAGPELGSGRPWPARAAAARQNGAPGRPSPLLAGAQRRLRRGLDIACPVLVICQAAGGHGPGVTGGLLPLGVLGALGTLAGRRATIRLGEHVTWLTLDGGLPGQAPALAPQRRLFLDELGRWLSAYLSGQIRDQLLLSDAGTKVAVGQRFILILGACAYGPIGYGVPARDRAKPLADDAIAQDQGRLNDARDFAWMQGMPGVLAAADRAGGPCDGSCRWCGGCGEIAAGRLGSTGRGTGGAAAMRLLSGPRSSCGWVRPLPPCRSVSRPRPLQSLMTRRASVTARCPACRASACSPIRSLMTAAR